MNLGAVSDTQPRALAPLRASALGKCYGPNLVLSGVDLVIEPGRVHVLFGENGAGKSTLISMLAGAITPTQGEIEIGGHRGAFRSVAHARQHGVRAVFQELSLVPHLSVAENMTLGEEPLSRLGLLSKSAARQQARRLIADLGFEIDADAQAASLPRGKQQMVEICKAVRQAPRVLILDEPTASLSEHDAQALFALIARLKAGGTAIVYITHRMHEIPLIGDVVSVLRDGRLVATVPADTPESGLIQLMTGRTLTDIYPSPRPESELGAVRLSLRSLSAADGSVADIDLDVRAGEILGIGGLVGCGKSELGQLCFGLLRRSRGEMVIDGRAVDFRHPAHAIAGGVWYSPPDRKRDGLALMRPAQENMVLSALRFGEVAGRVLRRRREADLATRLSQRVDFQARRLGEPVGTFSGGNQQKVLLARALGQNASVYIFDEPSVGVDIGARRAIYDYLHELSAAGAAIVLVSSDLTELLGLSHRICVMRSGRMVTQFGRDAFDQQEILEQFFD